MVSKQNKRLVVLAEYPAVFGSPHAQKIGPSDYYPKYEYKLLLSVRANRNMSKYLSVSIKTTANYLRFQPITTSNPTVRSIRYS